MTDEQKIAELNKLNKEQRKALKGIWLGRSINKIYVEQLLSNVMRVRVCNDNDFWLTADVGAKGGIKSKGFQQL
jgi:hypothetical protein